MAISLEDLQSRLDALRKARWSGVLMVEHMGIKTTYKSDADMANAESDLLGKIAGMSGSGSARPMASYATFNRGDLMGGRIGRFCR